MKRLTELVAGVLKVDAATVGLETGPRTHHKWDSFNHIALIVAVEETYGVELTPDEIVSLLSVSDIARTLEEKGVRVD